MAKDNNNGLYLPLKIDLTEWEKSLATADADLQKAMREMKSSMSDLKLRYDVEIANAKNAGDQLKVIELENQKLNRIYDEQRKAVEALNRAYQQSVKEKGASAKESQYLARQLVRESKELEKIKTQMNKGGLDIGKSLSDGLASVSPQFAKIRSTVGSLTSSLSSMGTVATTAATAIGGIGVAVGGIAVAYEGVKKVSESMRNTAEEAANASESVFMLAERLNLTYKEAEELDAVFTLDGTSAESFVNAVQKLNKQLLTAGDEGSVASRMLERYGVALRNADGTQKSYVEQLRALADGYKKAKEAGEGLDYVTATLGSAGNQYVHLLNGLDDYLAKTNELTRAKQVDYDLNHDLLTINGQLALQQKELAKASGNAYGDAAVSAKKQELEFLKERTRLMNENKEFYQQFAYDLQIVNKAVIAVEGQIDLLLDKIKSLGVGFVSAAANAETSFANMLANVSPVGVFGNFIMGALNAQKAVEDLKKKTESDNLEFSELAEMEKSDKKQQQTSFAEQEEQRKLAKQKEQETQKQLEKEKSVRERFNRELRDAQATEYEREINALRDKKQAYMDEGLSEVEADKLFTAQKEQIDQKYFNKLNAERQKQAKQAEEAYNKEIEAAKKAREASISEAEQTLKNNLKLLRYIENEKKKGTYNEENAKRYADNLYMKQGGYRQSDIDALRAFGVEELKKLADSRNRLFGDFANNVAPVTNNNTVNITFDGTVVEDVTAMDKLANKVADIITPAIQNALNGNVQYNYS